MLADSLPHLSQLCKLDLSYNSFTSYGLEALAGALLARNRNAVGAAAENRLSMHVYGNRLSEELETRIQALSVSPSMTHATDRMPNVRRYGAPPSSRGEMGSSGGGSGFTGASPYASSYSNYLGSVPSSRSGGGGGLPAPPSLVPSPMLVRAPVPRQAPAQVVHSKAPRCASSPPRGSTAPPAPTHPGLAAAAAAAATAPADPSRPLGSGKPTLLTAIPPPPPARRGSYPSEEGVASANGLADSLDFSVRMTYTSASKLTKIYGGGGGSPPLSPSGAGGVSYLDNGRRGSPNVPGQRPLSSPAPALKTLSMGISQMRAIVPGAPYAAALVNSGNNPLLNGNRNRPTAGSTGCGSGGGAASDSHYAGSGSGGGGGGTLPAVRKSYPLAEGTSASGASETDEGNGNGDGSVSGNGGENANGGKGRKPRVHGASEHLMLRTKCHTPDWVNRMQEDFYKKVTAPPRPDTPQGPQAPPPGPPSEHLFRKLLCHDSDWQRTKQMEQFMRETAPEPKPQPVPGAPVSAGMVSSVALIQRSGAAPRSTSPPTGTAVRSPYRSEPEPEPACGSTPTDPSEPVPEPTPEPETPQQPAPESESALQRPAVTLEDKSQQASTSGGEAAASGGAALEDTDDSPAQLSPSPPPPAGGVSSLRAGLSGRACGASGNLGSEESMEVLAVRNTGRKKAAIEVLRIRKAKDGEGGGAGVASGDGGASGDGDEDGDDDGAQTERDHIDGDGDGDGNGNGNVSSRDGRETDGSGEGGRALPPPESNPDGKDDGYTEGTVRDAAAVGSGGEDEQRAADGGDLADDPNGGEGDSQSRAAPSRGSSHSSSSSSRSSSSASEDLGKMQVRDGEAEAEALGGSAEEERPDFNVQEVGDAAAPDGVGVRGDIVGYFGNGPLSPVVSAS
ncbi:hypothetical protein Vafri_9902 [Volvox africanus]|uniref:Uncharacterized protein n=1 Tax=Volvox africanus TaxID=51714 RepID=A0A8J4B573_9CHLO|nr:hypothetical protein Vafri_9902 [Volvox africanus]